LGDQSSVEHPEIQFLEDVPCDEMRQYGQLVKRILGSKNPMSNNWSFATGVKRFDHLVQWDAEDVMVACVRLGSAHNPFYAIAFCVLRDRWVPYALCGMRHQIYFYLEPSPSSSLSTASECSPDLVQASEAQVEVCAVLQ
jgi:hypothetical protein